jgi:hypothetical protein
MPRSAPHDLVEAAVGVNLKKGYAHDSTKDAFFGPESSGTNFRCPNLYGGQQHHEREERSCRRRIETPNR